MIKDSSVNISKSIGTAIFILLLFGGIATAIPIDKTSTLGPYVSGSKYYLHVYNVDDTAKATVNGVQVVQTGYYQDGGWIDITSNLKDGSNTILLTNENGPGGWTYGFEIKKDSNVIFTESCGKVGTEGCRNNDGTQGIVYRNIITLTLEGIATAIPIDKTSTLGPYVSGSKYYVHLYNVDDTAKATVNNGLQVVQSGYYQDSGWIDITSNLKDGSNTILLTNENGPGGWTYGFEIKKDSDIIFTESCGKVGTEGCRNNDGTQGIVYRNIITLTLTKPAYVLSNNGLQFIADREGFSAILYPDAGGHCTIGYGHLVHLGPCNGKESAEFKAGITKAQGLEILRSDANIAIQAVNKNVNVKLNQNQFDAMVSFTFNIGSGNFIKSTVLKELNAGNYNKVPEVLLNSFVTSNGIFIQGLVNRRKLEGALFMTPTTRSADLNSDGIVNSADLGILMSNWGSTTKPKADINQDGIVDSVDYGIMMSQWG